MAEATVSFVRLGSNERDGRARFALLLATIVAFAIYKSWVIGLGRLAELWLGTAFEISVWALGWLLSEWIAGKRVPWRERVAAALFFPPLYLSAALVFAHSWFYDSAIERRLTALDVSAGGIRAFFHELPARGYWALGALLVGMHLLALLFTANLKRPRFSRALLAISGLSLLSFVGSALAPRTPSVLFDSGQELWQLSTLPRVVAKPVVRSAQRKAALDKSAVKLLPAPRFNRVVVLVMETMTSQLLERDHAALPTTSFFRGGGAHAHQYARYFPNNQDSRTGMLDMLSSRLIPYEAYGEEDIAAYEQIAGRESLVDRMRLLGYRTAFAVSQVELEEVVRDLKWDELLHLTPDELPALSKQHLCFQPDVWENSCEDLALLPRLVDFLAKSERAFVYQEFIWGHAYEYNAASGKTNAAYYSGYVDALIKQLAARGMLQDTLIAITSDHGFRDKSRQNDLGVYRIPLWFYAERFKYRKDARLLSHVDFKDLLFDELSESQTFTTPNERVLIVGPTGTGMLAAVSEDGGFTLIRKRGSMHLLQAQRLAGTARELGPDQLLYLFEHYRTDFDRALRAR
jgi:ABC-type multidrug transport system fused ATPase/permease subunit